MAPYFLPCFSFMPYGPVFTSIFIYAAWPPYFLVFLLCRMAPYFLVFSFMPHDPRISKYFLLCHMVPCFLVLSFMPHGTGRENWGHNYRFRPTCLSLRLFVNFSLSVSSCSHRVQFECSDFFILGHALSCDHHPTLTLLAVFKTLL